MIKSIDSSGRATTGCAQIKSICSALPTTTVIHLGNLFNISRVDYCNGILAGVPKHELDHLQSILNVAERPIFGYSRCDHITPLLSDRPYWLQVTQRFEFGRCLTVFKALHGLAQATSRIIASEYRQTRYDRVCVCKSQLSACAASVSNTIKFGERSLELAAHYVELSARHCKRC